MTPSRDSRRIQVALDRETGGSGRSDGGVAVGHPRETERAGGGAAGASVRPGAIEEIPGISTQITEDDPNARRIGGSHLVALVPEVQASQFRQFRRIEPLLSSLQLCRTTSFEVQITR